MLAIIDALKALRPWQIAVLVVVLFGAASATYGIYALVDDEGAGGLAENEQLIPVRLGDLINQVSTNGNLTFPNRETLTFGSSGTVEELLAEEGQQVRRDQVLARLDANTIATLGQTAAQARVDLKEAEDALGELIAPAQLILSQARQKTADAQLKLQQAGEALVDALESYTQQDFRAQEEAVARARLVFSDAGQAVASLVPNNAQLLAQVKQATADAEVALKNAQDAFAEVEPVHARQLVEARQTRDDALVALDQAGKALEQFQPDYDQALVEARQDKVDAEIALNSAQDALSRYEQVNALGLATARLDKADAEALLAEAEADLAILLAQLEEGVIATLPSQITGQRSLVSLRLERLATAQENVVAVEQLEAALESAQVNLSQARSRLVELEAGPDGVVRNQLEASLNLARSDLEEAESNLADLAQGLDLLNYQRLVAEVALAQANLEVARENQDSVLTEPLTTEVDRFRAKVAAAAAEQMAAQEALAIVGLASADPGATSAEQQQQRLALANSNRSIAEDALAAILAGVDPLEIALKETGAALAWATLTQAESDLDDILLGPDPLEVALKENDVAVASAVLAEADDDLMTLLSGPDAVDQQLLEAKINAAKTSLDQALERLENVTLKSPFDGFVSLVNVEVGDDVGASAVILEIVDPQVVEIDGIVDEIDVLKIRAGDQADVTMDSLPGRALSGVIAEIASAALNQQGVVTYPVRVRVQVPPGLELREGLSATANIIIQQERGVLLVPEQALYGSFQQPVVRVMTSSGVQERPVILGDTDGFWTVVAEGLAEGEQVVMEAASTVSDPFAAFRQLRGGFGGGGFSRGGPR